MADIFSSETYDTESYLKSRSTYPTLLYDTILEYHTRNSDGSRDLVVDVGCGPGQVASVLHEYFKQVIAVDPSTSMLETARRANSRPSITYQVGEAENMPFIHDANVDMVTAGTAGEEARLNALLLS